MTIIVKEIEFTRDGDVFDYGQVEAALEALPELTDLLVLSHGWNNDMAEARELYGELLKSVEQVLGADIVPGLAGRKLGAVCVFWPSKRFADEDLIPGGGAASASAQDNEALIRLLDEMKHNPVRLGGAEIDAVREANLSRAQELIPELESDPDARKEYVFRLRTVLDASATHVDDGSEEFFTVAPEELFEKLKGGVGAPVGRSATGAARVSAIGGAASLDDLLSGFGAAARRIANFTTYLEMKERAGRVGRVGLASVLLRFRERRRDLRLHLIGHSFGGRLVTAAAHALPPRTPSLTLALLQAAYSHNGLAENFDQHGHDGAFRQLISEKRASGPVLITHTKNDRAVGIAYPLASRFSRDPAAALGDENDPYGGMGRNGAQHTPEAQGLAGELRALDVGKTYDFKAGGIYNLRADQFIADHSDVTGQQVAYAVLHAIAACLEPASDVTDRA